MSRKKKNYEVGYGRPPMSSRFSATNQPKRPPNYARPKGKTITEIAEEVIDFTPRDGIPRRMKVGDLLIERLIQAALQGDMAAARRLLAQYDAEQDERATMVPGLSQRKHNELLSLAKKAFRRFARIDEQLQAQGLIAIVNGRRVVPEYVRQACVLRDQRRRNGAKSSGTT